MLTLMRARRSQGSSRKTARNALKLRQEDDVMAYAEQAETEALHEPKSFLTKYIWSCLLYTSDAADE